MPTSSKARVLFMGSDPIALPLLNWLVGSEGSAMVEVIGVFTQPDRKRGRGQKLVPNEIKTWARERGIPVHQPAKLTKAEHDAIAAMGVDLILVMAYGQILKQRLIDLPPMGCLNFHASLLPKYRGAAPINCAIAAGDTETGVSLMQIVRALDAGPVADVERVAIAPTDTTPDLAAKIAEACPPLLARNLPAILAGAVEFVPQDDSLATHSRKLTKDDAGIDFAAPADVIANRIRALQPWPGAVFMHRGVSIKVGAAEAMPITDELAPGFPPHLILPGVVFEASVSAGLAILAGGADRVVCPTYLQKPGGKMLPVKDFLRGYTIERREILPSARMEPIFS